MFSSLHLALSFSLTISVFHNHLCLSLHVLTISVFRVLIATSCSVFLSTCPNHLSLPCSHHHILLCLSLSQSHLHLALSFSLHVLTISVFHVLITTSCSVFLSTCPNHLSLPSSHVLLLTISVFHVLITTSCSVFLSTCPNHLSLPCSVFLSTCPNHSLPCSCSVFCLSAQSSMFSSPHLALSFSLHVLTISVFHVLITTSCSVFLSTCPNHLSLPCSHYYILLCLSLYMS